MPRPDKHEATTLITPGTRHGSFEIIARIGAGGMGEVYRAADTKLGRHVALKVLPPSLTVDAERLTRFDREARTLASLNHPHIAQIYGIELFPVADGTTQSALVMELVDGEDLAQRLARGPLSVDDALSIARQIVDALAAAHEQHIVHRDLKPANIRIRPDGVVKVLDFGLAKAADRGVTADATQSPTMTTPVRLTTADVIVGTAAYMSPEQARGRSVDRRADVWAFGCVLYEMLTGRNPFHRDSLSETLAAVMRDVPAFDALPPDVPPSVRRLLRRCLEKEPLKRLDSMRDARLEIDEPNDEPRAPEPSATRRRPTALPTVSLLASIAGIAFLAYTLGGGSDEEQAPVTRLELSLTPAASLGGPAQFARPMRPAFVVTPDGSHVVFAGIGGTTTQLYVRSLEAREATAIAGTVGAETPFLSPDSQWLGFLADGVVRKVALAGGPVVAIADLKSTNAGTSSALIRPGSDFFGASWGEDGTILFGRYNDGLWQVPAAGGTPLRVTTVRGAAHRLPRHLPGGRGVLLTLAGEDGSSIAVLPPGITEPRVLIESGTDGRFVAPSHIVFARDELLMAVPFDLDRLEITGTPFALEENVMVADGASAPAANSGAAAFDVARAGTLVFATGGRYPPQPERLVWVDRSGRIEEIKTSAGGFAVPRLSPDGRRVAVALPAAAGGQPDGIALVDLERNAITPLTRAGEWGPLWSPDGRQILFSQSGGMGRVRADGSSAIERLGNARGYPHSVTADGRTLLFGTVGPDSGSDIWTMPLDGTGPPKPLLNSPANEAWAALSPDEKWLAYGSDSSGRFEVYVQPFPALGSREQISVGGGDSPLWRRDGRELFYLTSAEGRATVHAVDVSTGSIFTSGKPRPLFTGRFNRTGSPTAYDVSPDGARFLLSERLDPPSQPVTRVQVVLNWFEELRKAQALNR